MVSQGKTLRQYLESLGNVSHEENRVIARKYYIIATRGSYSHTIANSRFENISKTIALLPFSLLDYYEKHGRLNELPARGIGPETKRVLVKVLEELIENKHSTDDKAKTSVGATCSA